MASALQAGRVRSSAAADGLPSLQRSQAVDHEEKHSPRSNCVSRLDSGLGTGMTGSSMDGNDSVNVAGVVSLTGGWTEPTDASAGEVCGRHAKSVKNNSTNETVPSEEGSSGYEEPGLCSEEDVLNFTFKVCDTECTGRVATSVIIQYLEEMTGQSKDGRLQLLHSMLDPEQKDVTIDRGSFHVIMSRWIANCTQDGSSEDKTSLNLRENPKIQSADRDEVSCVRPGPLEGETDSSKTCFQSDCTCAKGTGSSVTREADELINDNADLKYANKKLREQKNSLQEALEASDAMNLQLTKDLTKLKNQLMSSQRTLHSMQSVVEELEDARCARRAAWERVYQLGTQCKELKKENEALVGQLWSTSGKIEKMERDKRQLRYRIDELLAQNADLTKQIHEVQSLLSSKDAVIFEENILIEELKASKTESYKMIERLRAELKKSQAKICQDFFSYKLGVSNFSAGLPLNRPVWSPTSLQVEIQESQQVEGCRALPNPVCGLVMHKDQGDELQEIFSHVKAKRCSALFQKAVNEMVDQLNINAASLMAQLRRVDSGQQLNVQELRTELEQTMQAVVRKLHLLAPMKDSWDESVEVLERACMQCQQENINTKHSLANVIRELELEKGLREEAEEQAAEAEQRAEEAMLEAKSARARSLAGWKLEQVQEDVAAPGRDVQVVVPQVDRRSLESNQELAKKEERLCPLEPRAWQPIREADTERCQAEERMAAALEATEAGVRGCEGEAAEAGRRMVEVQQAAASAAAKAEAEEEKARRRLVEAEGLKQEVERLRAQAEESTKRMWVMEEQAARLTQMLSTAQHRAALAEEGLSAALAKAREGDGQRKVAAENATAALVSSNATEAQRALECPLSGESSTKHCSAVPTGELPPCPASVHLTNVRAARPHQEELIEQTNHGANRKRETDVRHLPQETIGPLHQQSPWVHSGECSDNAHSTQYTPLLDALNLEPSQSRQPFGFHKHFRPPSLDQNRGEIEKSSPSKEPLSEGRGSHTTGRNNVGRSRSQEVDEEQRVSPGTEAQLPASAIPEDDDSSPSLCLRQQLTNFTFPGFDPFCRSPGSLPCGPRCVVAPRMPTLPEEEEGSEHRESAQHSKSNVPTTGSRMNSTPAIVLPEVTGPSDRDFDQTTHIRCHSPIQRRSSRNSRASLSSASSLTSVDGKGHVYDLVNDELPDVELSDEDKKKNAELLEEAKKISESFLNRRPRHSRASLGDSPPARTPTSSPSPSRSNSITRQQHIELEVTAVRTMVSPPPQAVVEPCSPLIRDKEMKLLEVPGTREHDAHRKSEKHTRKLSPTRKMVETRKLSPGAAGSRVTPSGKVVGASVQRNDAAPLELRPRSESKPLDNNGHGTHSKEALSAPSTQAAPDCKALPGRPSQPQVSDLRAPLTGTVQTPPRSRTPCRAEIKSLSSQPLLRAISWECLELDGELKAPPSPPIQAAESFGFSDVLDANQLKASNCKELPTQPKLQKLTKLREENKLMRNQNLAGQRLPDLSEITEQDRGPSPGPSPAPDGSIGGSDITPSITDSLLWKLKVQRSLPGGLPPLTEKEIENTFIQLSLAFKNDSYTLEARLGLAERERNLAEDNTEKELENFRSELKSSASLWMHTDHRDAQERLQETVAVLQRLAIRLSARAEIVGAVRQEKRMFKATDVMMQYVDNLKRMYEKDHAELAEFKKMANQISSRSYTPYGDSSDDGVPRTARSMSLTLGKTVPRRRVSVAVLPKFINFPGQSTSNSTMTRVVPVMESNSATSTSSSESSTTSTAPSSSSRNSQPSGLMLSPLVETKQNGDREAERLTPDAQPVHVELTRPETKAKIEEEAFNKGYQEGLKAQLSQEQKELRQEAGRAEEASEKPQAEPSVEEERKTSKLEEVSELVVRLWPKPLKRRGVMWLVAAAVLLLAVLTSMVTSHREPCEQEVGTPGVKGSCHSGPSSPWPFSRLWHKTRVQA